MAACLLSDLETGPQFAIFLVTLQQCVEQHTGLGAVRQVIGIGTGIELAESVFAELLADRLATLSEPRQYGQNTVDQRLPLIVVVRGQRLTQLPHFGNHSARKHVTSCDFKLPASIPVRRLAVYLGP